VIVNQSLVFFAGKPYYYLARMKKFLVIDSDRALLGQLARWLQSQGWALLESADTAQAMTLALEQKPSVILCDLLSPHSNALQFCRDLRRQADLKPAPPSLSPWATEPSPTRLMLWKRVPMNIW
jgi:CheY-like chemotaxis protein